MRIHTLADIDYHNMKIFWAQICISQVALLTGAYFLVKRGGRRAHKGCVGLYILGKQMFPVEPSFHFSK